MSLPSEADRRKAIPLCRGVLDYFPDALCEVAELSRIGNEQHSPGEPMHWAKEKSTDEADALMRHLIERGRRDTDGVRHTAKVAWRALALLQREIDAETSFNETTKSDCSAEGRVCCLCINLPDILVQKRTKRKYVHGTQCCECGRVVLSYEPAAI